MDRGSNNYGEAATKLSNEESQLGSVSPIYPSSLDSTHFRLIYLTESDDVSSPIHIRLEEYALDDRPEYETVSYVWGGEEGNSTLCEPVYVGSFWDVVLATKNCSALLHYLRPRRGCRIIWMDAICINQTDNIEKPAQISIMSDIYANCERVVAYLGRDLVNQSLGRTFRPRIDFQESAITEETISDDSDRGAEFLMTCAESAGMSQHQLLKRRFLTRIWIVQELSFSKKALFPLGSFDILCDRKEAMHLVLRDNRERLAISAVDGKSLSHLLRATSHCRASDPRDRVYGLLGLFEPQDISRKLVSDYSLSWRDCWVGTAAYMLLVERNLVLLAHAVGTSRPTCMPSWVPDIQKAESWFVDPTSMIHGKSDSVSENVASTEEVKTTATDQWRTEFVMYSVDDKELQIFVRGEREWWGQESHRLVNPRALYTRSIGSASIDSSNGALQLRALRVFNGPCQLTVEAGRDGLTSIWVRGPSTAAHFRIMGLQQPMISGESHELFIISCGDPDSDPDSVGRRRTQSSQTVLLVLANAVSEGDSSVVTLRNCFMVYDVHFYSMDQLVPALESIDDMINNALHSLHWVLHTLYPVPIASYASRLRRDWIIPGIFPSGTATTRDLFPLLIRLTEQKRLSAVRLALAQSISATAESICPDFDPLVWGGYLHLTIKNEAMSSMLFALWGYNRESRRHLSRDRLEWFRDSLVMDYTYSLVQDVEVWTRLSYYKGHGWRRFWDGNNFPVTVRFSLDHLVSCLKRTTPYIAMCYAREFSSLFNEGLETFLSRSPMVEDRSVFLEDWGSSLVEELGLVWKFERINIM